MFKVLTISTLSLLIGGNVVSAQTATPTATVTPTGTPVSGRLLTCQNSSGKIAISHCGISGCSAVVTLGTKAPVTYRVVRTKNSDGSLTYAPRTGSKPKCSATISALRYGTRRVTAASCAPTLKNAACNIN